MKRNKHIFHCHQCGSATTTYKKGKKHRILVCPNCGILATNPLPLAALAAAAAPSLIEGAINLIGNKKTPKTRLSDGESPILPRTIKYDNLDKPNMAERIAFGR
jgi:hypothetical protein